MRALGPRSVRRVAVAVGARGPAVGSVGWGNLSGDGVSGDGGFPQHFPDVSGFLFFFRLFRNFMIFPFFVKMSRVSKWGGGARPPQVCGDFARQPYFGSQKERAAARPRPAHPPPHSEV